MTGVPEIVWVCDLCGYSYGPLPIKALWVSHDCKRTKKPSPTKSPEGPLFMAEMPSVLTRRRDRKPA